MEMKSISIMVNVITKIIHAKNHIKAKYSGFNSGMIAYINFLPNKKVEFIGLAAYFTQKGVDSSFYFKNDDNFLNPWIKSLKGNYGNTIKVSDILKAEKRLNLENNSKVKVQY